MIRMEITYLDVVLTFSSGRVNEVVEINSGVYKDKNFRFLVICDNKVFLEGDDVSLLKKDFDILKLHVKSNVEKVASFLNRESIFIDGIDAINEDEKEDVIRLLLSK